MPFSVMEEPVMPTTTDNSVELSEENVQGFVDNYFGEVDLGHKSRNACFRRVAQQISRLYHALLVLKPTMIFTDGSASGSEKWFPQG